MKNKKETDTKEIPQEWLSLISLLKAAVTGSEIPVLSEKTDYNKLFSLAERHNISSLLFTKLDNRTCPQDVYAKWKDTANYYLIKEIRFDGERAKITEQFEKQGIKYMPLKGIILSSYYPKKGTREFSDNDILIDPDRVSDAESIMTSLGYKLKSAGPVHDGYLKEPLFNFELHKSLFSDTLYLYEHYKDVWDMCVRDDDDSFGYHLKNEDFYVYMTAHFFKHYSDRGAGLRSFADLFIMKRRFENDPEFDRSYVEEKLREYRLDSFESEVGNICRMLFSDDSVPTRGELSYIIESGTYGIVEHRAENGIKNKGKLRYVLSRLFIPYSELKHLYPALKKAPFLLPFFWIVRLIKRFSKMKQNNNMRKEIRTVFRRKDS